MVDVMCLCLYFVYCPKMMSCAYSICVTLMFTVTIMSITVKNDICCRFCCPVLYYHSNHYRDISLAHSACVYYWWLHSLIFASIQPLLYF